MSKALNLSSFAYWPWTRDNVLLEVVSWINSWLLLKRESMALFMKSVYNYSMTIRLEIQPMLNYMMTRKYSGWNNKYNAQKCKYICTKCKYRDFRSILFFYIFVFYKIFYRYTILIQHFTYFSKYMSTKIKIYQCPYFQVSIEIMTLFYVFPEI